jgi:hypothetical protein
MRFVPQISRSYSQIQLLHAWHAQYAHAFFLSTFVNVENKGSLSCVETVGVWGSNPLARAPQQRFEVKGSSGVDSPLRHIKF